MHRRLAWSFVALLGCGPARAPVDNPHTEPADVHTRSVVIGIVEGGPWIAGGPPNHRAWRVAHQLDAAFDVAPVALDQELPAGVGVLVVPLLSALTQSQLDRLSEAIDAGLPAVVIVDPLPIADLELMPGSEIRGRFDGDVMPEPGDHDAFLKKYGVRWMDKAVLVGSLPLGHAPRELLVVDGRGPVIAAWAGAIDNVGASAWDPILTARGAVEVGNAEDYVQRHPLFGISGPLHPVSTPQPRPGPAVVASKVHDDLVVVADLDLFSDTILDARLELDDADPAIERQANADLLAGLLRPHLRSPATAREAVRRAPLWTAGDAGRVAAIEIVERVDWPPIRDVDEAEAERRKADQDEQGRPVRWLRLERRDGKWTVRSTEAWAADEARVEAMIRAIDGARWGGASTGSTLLDPTLESRSAARRLVARDADGRTLLDLVVGDGVARQTYASATLQLRIDADLATEDGAFVRAIRLGIDPRKVESIAVSRYRLDSAHGELLDRADAELGSSRAAAVQALNAIELTPHERLPTTGVEWRLQASGLFRNMERELIGTIGHVVVATRTDTIRIAFGALVDGQRRIGIASTKAEGIITVYRVPEAAAQALLRALA